MGREEIDDHRAGASRRCAPKGSTSSGPCRPTRCSTRRARARYDVALTMYHDQGLIPVKTLAFDDRRQRHARPALRAHIARSRHGVRYRRQGHRQSVEPHCGAEARRPADAMTLAADGLPPLREVVAAARARRAQGARPEFPVRPQPDRRNRPRGGPLAGVAVVEVGPGPGGLTRALLAEGAKKVIAIERDERALPALADIGARWPGRLEVLSRRRADGRARNARRQGRRRAAPDLRQPALQRCDAAARRAGWKPSPGRRSTTA